ncbi:MAG TPA: sulfite exporter TauE/SafE family protein [Acidimicrobiales bacterium]|nr:sulfite exporter TauE/SafE family protein [Acidimicrobiales bacterium]
MVSTADTLVLLAAGGIAGVVGTAGGITSLISYPALLWVGIAAAPANVANIVALVTYLPGSALASRPELRGKGPWLWRWAVLTATCGGAGAALLLLTPSKSFAKVVPFLVVAGSLALLAQPSLTSWRERRRRRGERLLLPCGLVPVSVYSGYFGAGSGVMTLALLLLTVERDVVRANALKNVLVGVASAVSATILVLFTRVDWAAVVPLGIGTFAGSTVGPLVARRVRGDVLRWAVALVGLGLALRLWLGPS